MPVVGVLDEYEKDRKRYFRHVQRSDGRYIGRRMRRMVLLERWIRERQKRRLMGAGRETCQWLVC